MKNKKVLIIILVISIIVNIILFSVIFGKERVTIYKTNILSDDIEVNNITLVSIGKVIYIQDGFEINALHDIENIEYLGLEINVDGKQALTVSMGDIYPKINNIITRDLFGIIDKIKIKENSVIEAKLKYKINGQEKEEIETIPMKSAIKYKN